MSNQFPSPAAEPVAGRPPGLPGWAKLLVLAVVVLVLVVVGAMLLGGGTEHGPGRHG